MSQPEHGSRDDLPTERAPRRRLPEIDPPVAGEESFAPGFRIGPYRIEALLGQGGMGRVYLAEQREPLRRHVALKLIRETARDDAALRRFHDEAQALARMSHPAIAQVFEAGTTVRGRPFIAMEYVAGKPITRYADRCRLDLAARLRLFATVCDGVQHAHEKSVLHRDIKPSNVLVAVPEPGQEALPKIIDFGISKALDRTPAGDPLTRRWIGTPGYLSPEAVEAGAEGVDIDTRSDIYSLGVVLFTLLTGAQPFGGGTDVAVLRRIVEEEAPRPSQCVRAMSDAMRRKAVRRRRTDGPGLVRALRGDLDWIVMAAMAKKRQDRYASAAELAADVRRHLDHRPVLVGPPHPLYRAGKLVRRHLAAVVAGVLIVAALAGGLVARSIEARRANREAERANRQAAAAEQVSDFLIGLFRDADPASIGASADVTASQLLDRGADRIRSELAEQPLARGRILVTIGNAYRELGLFDQAEPLMREALTHRQANLPPDDPEVIDSQLVLGELLHQRGRLVEGEALIEGALAVLPRSDRSDPSDERLGLRARALMNLAGIDAATGRLERAETRLLEAIAVRKRLDGPAHRGVAAALNNLANVYYDLERYDDAEAAHRESIAIKEKVLGPEHFHLAQSYNNLANVLLARGDHAQAQALHEKSLAIKRQVLPPEHLEIGVSLHNLGNLAAEQGAWDEAERLQREALAVFESTLAPDHVFLSYPAHALGELARRAGRLGESAAWLGRALTIREAAGPASAIWRQTAEVYSEVLTALGERDRAERLRERLAAEASS